MDIPEGLAPLFPGPGLAELGPGPRAGVTSEPTLKRELDRFLQTTNLAAERAALVRAVVLLWHDHLDSAHVIAQGIESPHGAIVHGIMHRREPDYNNAAYWFRRAGEHPIFPELWRRATALLSACSQSELGERLAPGGVWSPFEFIEECRRVATTSSTGPETMRLREIQGIESELLLEFFCTK